MPVIKVKSEEVKIKVPVTVLRIEPTTQTKTVEPSIEKQLITPDKGIFALSSVTVNPVTSEIDENIKAENIKEGVSILGVEGEVKAPSPDMVNINDYLETTITSENAQYFFIGSIFKKIPENFKVETTDLSYLFASYRGGTFPVIDTSLVTNMRYMCSGCRGVKTIPNLNTSNCEDFLNFASSASNLESVPLLDFSKAKSISNMFMSCYTLVELGGFKDLGKSYETYRSTNYSSYKLTLSDANNLTEQSLINVLNNLYDIASRGVKTQTCQLGSTNLAKLTSVEGQQALANAQAKGWTIS
jgi:hypothetical protein